VSGASRTTHPDEKGALRAALIAARAKLAPEERLARARRIAARLDALPEFASARTVALYVALGAEVPSEPVLERALARGVRVVLPRVAPGTRVLSFAACPPSELVLGAAGAREPPAACAEVPGDEIDLFVVPGVAFGEDGGRLGRGGGYYDATLAAFPRARRVGVAYEPQIVPALPREGHDARVDLVVTEERVRSFVRSSSLTPGAPPGDVTGP
jgi:5-formyltetrahydrofolate cyclo-ligase